MKMNPRIYLDNNATTFLDPHVAKIVIQSLQSIQGNPSSVHSFGQEAKAALNKARRLIADFLHVKPSEILFNSGGTEGLNTLLYGRAHTHVITSSVEHASVYTAVKKMGCDVTFLNPGLFGAVSASDVLDAIKPETSLITLMAVNNETGVKTDISSIAEIAQERKIPFVVDGVALLGKEDFQIHPGISAMAFSGHKIHAPKGVGFIYLKSTFAIDPLLGGVQEYGKRGGTENLHGIIGLAEAIRLLEKSSTIQIATLRDKLEKVLLAMEGVHINGEGPRVCNTSNVSFEGVEGETLLAKLDLAGVAVSHGSACSSGALEPSRILLNMGIPRERAASSIRISLSRFTTESEIDRAGELIVSSVRKLRK